MVYDPRKHQRRSIRLQGYDYSQPGAYFVTICTRNRESLFGEIVEGEMILNEYGQIVAGCWICLAKQYTYAELDEWVVMPNHLHGILAIVDDGRGMACRTPTGIDREAPIIRRGDRLGRPYTPNRPHGPAPGSIGAIVGQFKSIATKRINAFRGIPGAPVWQRNYYEHIIRNEDELNRLRQYILDNPVQWEMDENNPNRQMDASSCHKTFSTGMVGAWHAAPYRLN
jgi:REP element-mobilizing transposase RayT